MGLKSITNDHLEELVQRYPDLSLLAKPIIQAVEIICECHKVGGKVLVCGNGGSAADSEHIVGELMKGFVLPRRIPDHHVGRLREAEIEEWQEFANSLQQGVQAIALTGHSALSSAILNDTDPFIAFAQQVYVYGREGDVFIGLSTSGNSRNVVAAAKVAKAFGLATVGFTGSRASKMDEVCDVMIKVPAVETYKIQEYHLPIYHTICLMVESELFGDQL